MFHLQMSVFGVSTVMENDDATRREGRILLEDIGGLAHRCPKFPLVGWFIEGFENYPYLQPVNDDADGIPVTDPVTYLSQKDMIGWFTIHRNDAVVSTYVSNS